jgi:DNA-binding PadR family transcriptional regulator
MWVRRREAVAWADPGLLILGSLSSGAKHGYAIQQDVLADTGVDLGPGTLYGALARLERDGLVMPLSGGERRRPYRLTAEGVRVLRDRIEHLQRFARLTTTRLAGMGA